jgi:methyl-accepting chemotaxis protein
LHRISGSTIVRISEVTTVIATAVEEQGTAKQDISRNVQEAARGTSRVSANTGAASAEVLARPKSSPPKAASSRSASSSSW